jgi:hypothetical protein
MTDDEILVLAAASPVQPRPPLPPPGGAANPPPGGRGWGRSTEPAAGADPSVVTASLPGAEFERRLGELVGRIGSAVAAADSGATDFQVAEVQVSVTVTAEGKLALLGAGVGASSAATFQLTLRRRG